MNKYKVSMSKKANGPIIDKEMKAISTNPKQVKPITNSFIGMIYRIHINTTRKLKMFKSTSWYAPAFRLIQSQRDTTLIIYDSDDVEKLADDSTPMLMRIRAENNSIKRKILDEYSIAGWLSREAMLNVANQALDMMTLDIIQIISQDRCFLFYKSRAHGNERLKAQYYYKLRSVIFDIVE